MLKQFESGYLYILLFTFNLFYTITKYYYCYKRKIKSFLDNPIIFLTASAIRRADGESEPQTYAK